MIARQLPDLTIAAVAGIVSAADQRAIEALRIRIHPGETLAIRGACVSIFLRPERLLGD